MYGLNRVSPATTTYQQWLFRFNSPFRSIFSKHSSPAGVDDFVNVGEGGKCWYSCLFPNSKISGEALPAENESKPYERKVLPPELSRSVVRLTCESSAHGGVCDVYLVGTVHVSKKSCREVKAVIEFLKPQVVFLELCCRRLHYLHATEKIKVPTIANMVEDMWKKNDNPLGIFYSWFAAKVASKLEVVSSAEFRVAYEEAMKYGGKCILGDRSILSLVQGQVLSLEDQLPSFSSVSSGLWERVVHDDNDVDAAVASIGEDLVSDGGDSHSTRVVAWHPPAFVRGLAADCLHTMTKVLWLPR
ncbi:TraB family protein [Perilla frutescens var. frutescens]|nr:TraB family protein [Perilla frutescens var. frutescens]